MQALTDIYAEMANLEHWMGRRFGWCHPGVAGTGNVLVYPRRVDPRWVRRGITLHSSTHDQQVGEWPVIQRGCQEEHKAKNISRYVGLDTR